MKWWVVGVNVAPVRTAVPSAQELDCWQGLACATAIAQLLYPEAVLIA